MTRTTAHSRRAASDRSRALTALVLWGAAGLFLAAFLLVPLVAVFVQAFADGAAVYWKAVTDPRARESITIDFAPVSGSPIGEVAAKFDIVVGRTPPA